MGLLPHCHHPAINPRSDRYPHSDLPNPRETIKFSGPEDQQPATMLKDHIQLLFEYDRWANNRVLQAVSALRDEQFTRDVGGSFRSVRDTLVHIISGEWGWLAYWKEPSLSPAFVKDLRDRRDSLFNPDKFPNITQVKSKWAEIEKEQLEFVNGLTNESLEKMLPIRATQISLANLMQHLANHSTYHRGQVALMMRQLDAEPVATDFHVFLVETQTR
jgi:uncharacterized damage-inducible protein DinB